MKTPAPVAYRAGQPQAMHFALVALMLLLVAVGAWWVYQQFLNPVGQWWRSVLLLLTLLGVSVGLYRYLQRDPKGMLRFDGENWWYLPPQNGHAFSEQAVALQLIWDAQTLICVRMSWCMVPDEVATSPAQTLWLSGNFQTPTWLPLRRALLATARIITPHATTV